MTITEGEERFAWLKLVDELVAWALTGYNSLPSAGSGEVPDEPRRSGYE